MNQWTRLRGQLEELLRWEKRRRVECLLIESFVYAALAAVLAVPLNSWLPVFLTPLSLAPAFFLLLAAVFLAARRFRGREIPLSLNRLDHELNLAQRGLTAWEILERSSVRPSEQLVLEEADARLADVRIRSLFKREFGWHAYVAPLLLVLLLATPWLPPGSEPRASDSVTLAQGVKDLASQTAKEARRKGLTESGRVARDLSQVAEKKLRGDSDREELGHALGAIVDSIEDIFQSLPVGDDVYWPGIGTDQLSDVRQRLGELQSGQPLPDGLSGGRRGLLDELGLATMAKRFESRQTMSEKEIEEFLQKLTREAKAEQERRLLDRTRQALSQLLRGNPEGSGTQEFAARGPSEESAEPGPDQGLPGSNAGDAPARPGAVAAYDPTFRAQVRSHLQGLLGEGPSRGFGFRGRGQAGRSTVVEEEVVVHYERQIEEQMSSEEIPADFKDTIKNYFLSLGVTTQ